MKQHYSLIIWLFALIMVFTVPSKGEKVSPKDLPEKYRKWFEEDVIYIITSKEKEVFLQLETDRERDLFIEAFWKHRDPTPGTPENENRQEHYSRIEQTNRKFGVGSLKPGWKTDRGKIYIILGEPQAIESHTSLRELRDMEIWFYQDMTKYGLPSAFYVVFCRKDIASDFELYSPAQDGPYSLFINPPQIDPADYLAAYELLRDISTSIAEVSISLIPGDASLVSGRPSLASEMLIHNINLKPYKEVDDLYAEKLLKYKGIVEVEYTSNFIDSDYLAQIIRDPNGMFFVNYLIIPKRLSVGQYQNTYYANFLLNGQIADPDNKIIYQFEKEYSLDLNEDKLNTLSNTSFQINDMFPLIPGTYSFSLLLKNTVSKEFTSFEETITIPSKIQALTMGPILLSYSIKDLGGSQAYLRPFQIKDKLFFCEPKSIFLLSDEMIIYFQLFGVNEFYRGAGKIIFSILKEEETIQSFTRQMSDYADPLNILEKTTLSSLSPADYTLKISVLDSEEIELISQTKHFAISPVTHLARPYIQAKALPASHGALNNYRIGIQFYNKGEYEAAERELRKASAKMPSDMDIAVSLAKTCLALKKYKEIDPVLTPFLDREDAIYEVYFYLGRSAQLRSEYERAIQHFRAAISHYGINFNLLNALGECFFRMNNIDEAKRAWEKSLEINPDQPQIRKRLNLIKVKKQ